MAAFAKGTDIEFERSIAEISSMLRRAGAEDIGQIDGRDGFQFQFVMADRLVRFRVTFPNAAEIKAITGPRSDPAAVAEQWRRQRGRALLLVIKAKVESVASKVESFEEAFLANVVMPGTGGRTLYEQIAAPLAEQYRTQVPGQLLLGGKG